MTDWNERYKTGQHTDHEPHPTVVRFASQLPAGRALDLACGAGRHSIWLAERGWEVTAVDYSPAAIDLLKQRSESKSLTIDTRIADLERGEFLIEPASYDLILICHYLQRDLFPSVKAGTATGGIVIAVSAMIDDDPDVKPMNPAYLLKPGELRNQFAGWEWIWDFEGKREGERRRAAAEIVARRR